MAGRRYEEKYERALIDHINDEVDGDFRDFLVECLKCERDEEGGTDEDLAAEQAARLQEAAAGWGTDEAAFIEILGASSVEQMDLIEAAFEDLAGQSLKNTIEGEMGGDLEYAMLLRLETPVAAQCRILKKAFDGTGTDEDAIARVLGGATKADALVIKATYDEKYSADLRGELESECGGDLGKAVLKWLAEPELGYFSDGELQAADALKGSTETPAEVSDEAISGFLVRLEIPAPWRTPPERTHQPKATTASLAGALSPAMKSFGTAL